MFKKAANAVKNAFKNAFMQLKIYIFMILK